MSKISKFIIIFSLISLSIYSIFIEPNWLEITKHNVSIGKNGNKIKIAHVTDLHSDHIGKVERKLLKAIEEEKPDVIFITGDIATPGGEKSGYIELLSQFKAPLGVFFVNGNWEHWERDVSFKDVINQSKVIDLNNKTFKLRDNFFLIGYDDIEGIPDKDLSEQIPHNAIAIGLFHSPDFFNSVKANLKLAFAGHSHGGQVRLPIVGSLWTPRGSGGYINGWYKDSVSKLFVSRGLGNSILPIRLNCRPELAIINLEY